MTALHNFALVTAASAAVLAAVQTAAFAVGRKIGRYNVVDVAWGLGFVAAAVAAAALGQGDLGRRLLFAALIALWGLRLSWHMHRKSAGRGEDPRYEDLLERKGGASTWNVIVQVFVIQGLAQWFVSLPVQLSAVLGPTSGAFFPALVAGVALFTAGVLFEAIGDRQLRAFKSDPANRGRIMDVGLWRWTRHPNYFGDSCVWWGLWLCSLASLASLATVLSPALMTYFLVHATGARLLERHMADRPGYREYQRRTSFFVPWPPRS
jgi:steroid 5-alpha reductase family enzyme